ncbi:hypothetical protein [Pseudoalteromonas marina]|uniref:Uncharacterized protein n=1 Tax=Pseudoalteromonas marina TaxID=267375 RepID=A0ABT9FI30_9GAMM|nr:hypothetical protein [Pseudoalteromonas marina]MDP2566461.1 hypothetical protein [Pseudoalteromonas marina]
MNNQFERYTNSTMDQTIQMEFFGKVGKVSKITIGSRFERLITIRPSEFGTNVSAVNQAFDFFNNIAPLLDYAELSQAWKKYTKACKQGSYETHYAFWNYMDGKKIKRIDRKGAVSQWVYA